MGELNKILTTPSGRFKIMATSEKGALTVPQMFDQGILRKIPTFEQLAQWPNDANRNRLASRTMGVFSRDLPLCEQPTENGKLYIEKKTLFTHTRLGGFTVDALRKAGIDVEKPGIFLAMDEGYVIADVHMSWPLFQYSILAQDMPPEQLARTLRPFYNVSSQSHVSLEGGKLDIQTARYTNEILYEAVLKNGIFYFEYEAPGPFTIRSHSDYFSSGWMAEIGAYTGPQYGYAVEDGKR